MSSWETNLPNSYAQPSDDSGCNNKADNKCNPKENTKNLTEAKKTISKNHLKDNMP